MLRMGVLCVVALCVATASGEVATFDSLYEGWIGETFTDGGIEFYDLDNRLEPDPWFGIESASENLGEFAPEFTPPNALSWTILQVGPLTGFFRCGEFRFRTGKVADYASLELWDFSPVGGNKVTLEAYMGKDLVNSTSITLLPRPPVHHYTLAVSGVPFNNLRLVGSGSYQQGCWFGPVDTVVVSPEPAGLCGLALGALLLRRRGEVSARSQRGPPAPGGRRVPARRSIAPASALAGETCMLPARPQAPDEGPK